MFIVAQVFPRLRMRNVLKFSYFVFGIILKTKDDVLVIAYVTCMIEIDFIYIFAMSILTVTLQHSFIPD